MRVEFTVHRLHDEALARVGNIAEGFASLLDDLEQLNGIAGREMAVVRTKLEEACFFAKKAFASRPENQG